MYHDFVILDFICQVLRWVGDLVSLIFENPVDSWTLSSGPLSLIVLVSQFFFPNEWLDPNIVTFEPFSPCASEIQWVSEVQLIFSLILFSFWRKNYITCFDGYVHW